MGWFGRVEERPQKVEEAAHLEPLANGHDVLHRRVKQRRVKERNAGAVEVGQQYIVIVGELNAQGNQYVAAANAATYPITPVFS